MPMNRQKFWVDDKIWFKAAAKTAREGTTPSALIRQWLEDYVNDTVTPEQPLNAAKVAEFLGVSRQRVHQIRKRAIEQ